MLRSKSSHRLSRGQQLRATLSELLLAHKLWLLWGLGTVWLLYLGLSAVQPPYRDTHRHTRSLLEASVVSGRLEALSLDQHPVDALRAAVRTALSPVGILLPAAPWLAPAVIMPMHCHAHSRRMGTVRCM